MRIVADDYFKQVDDISTEYLEAHSIAGIILDIDNTIVIDGEMIVSPQVSKWFRSIRLPVCLLSNGKEYRVKLIAEKFGVVYIYKAKKPLKSGYVKAVKLLNIEDMSKIVVIGDQLFSDILGGRLAGCYTIKIEPINRSADPLSVKVKRWFERFVM